MADQWDNVTHIREWLKKAPENRATMSALTNILDQPIWETTSNRMQEWLLDNLARGQHQEVRRMLSRGISAHSFGGMFPDEKKKPAQRPKTLGDQAADHAVKKFP